MKPLTRLTAIALALAFSATSATTFAFGIRGGARTSIHGGGGGGFHGGGGGGFQGAGGGGGFHSESRRQRIARAPPAGGVANQDITRQEVVDIAQRRVL